MRASSSHANLPQWRGQDGFFEIWFIVAIDPTSRRAFWIRYTTFAPTPGRGDERRAMLWAAAFREDRAPRAICVKSIFDDDDYDGGNDDAFLIRVGPASMGNDFCRGESRGSAHSISWQLHYQPKIKEAQRMSPILTALPLPTRARHANPEIEVDGWVTVDGERHELRGAPGIQMHLYGTGRAEELFWLYAPAFAEDHRAVLEVSSARTHRQIGSIPIAAVAPLWLSTKKGTIDHTGLVASLKTRITRPRPGILGVESSDGKRKIRIRAYGPLDTFVGYRYRQPAGGDLCVAQSDIASTLVEVFEASGIAGRLTPSMQLCSRASSALEFHAPEPMPSIRYVEWEDSGLDPLGPASIPPRSPDASTSVDQAGLVGRFEPLPSPQAIFGLGLTYRRHITETGGDPDAKPEVFRKSTQAWLPVGDVVTMPDSGAVLTALDGLEPGIAAELSRRFGATLAMLDYEVELGMWLLDDVSEADAQRPSFAPPVGYFVANNLTARSCQVLGEGQPQPMAYWTLAKSFPGFLPVTPSIWVPDVPGSWPRVTLRTRVNGELRQEGHSSDVALTPRQMLAHVIDATQRDLRRGDAILTGTPSGIAFRVSKLKRRLGRFLLGRFGRLSAAFDAYARSDRFLLPGDRVEFDAGPLGQRAVTIGL